MKRRGILLLFVFGLLLPVGIDASIPQSPTVHPLASVDFWVDALDYYNYYWSSIGEDYIINIDIEVTSGTDIDFYILDEDNYDLFSSGYSSYAEVIRENIGSVSYSFTVPTSGEWHLIFRNDNWIYRKHIEGIITAVAPQAASDPSGIIGGITIAIVFVIIIACIVNYIQKYEKQKQQGQQGYQPTYLPVPQSPVQPKTAPAQTRFCPYCGTPKQLYDAQFCSVCGRAFRGPDLG